VLLEGSKHVAVPNGSVITTPGWAARAAGFDVDATAGAARVAVTARAD
jgi:type III secretory pathway component EscT